MADAHGHGGATWSVEHALERLMAGHKRFLDGTPRFNGLGREELARLAEGQQPYATILGCADSRVPPEVIFDAGPGELFVIRVAGNVLSPEVAGSMQYAGAHLQTPVFVVLGHSGCGAVQAALASRNEGVQHLSRIQSLVDSILPVLDDVNLSLPPHEVLDRAVEANVRHTVRAIAESPEGQARIRTGERKLVGAIYDLASGRVRVLEVV